MKLDAVIVGAGASGLMCALMAARRSRSVLLIDHEHRFGRKILISGGGRCNFSNLDMSSSSFISANKHFPKSALARFGTSSITDMLDQHGIRYFEKTDGQLFLTKSSGQILDMFVDELKDHGVNIKVGRISSVKREKGFILKGDFGIIETDRLVIATGGLSYPKLGASDFGLKIAKQFGHRIVPPRPALVPLVFSSKDRSFFSKLSGASCHVKVSSGNKSFCGDILFTHRGVSGPVILRISSHWKRDEELRINFFPKVDIIDELEKKRSVGSRMELKTLLARHLPTRLAALLCTKYTQSRSMNSYSKKELIEIAKKLSSIAVKPQTTEGYDKAEVTAGGVDTHGLSSKTLESKLCPDLYFIGEVIDVTGDLGGYNLHWAWASGHAAGAII